MNNYRIVYPNELNHYGVRGMKWGVRKQQPTSMGGRFHRLAAANYDLNARTYDRLGNKALASMNRTAANQSRKKAEAADASKVAKKQAKVGAKIAKKQAIANAKISYKEAKAKSNAARKAYNKSFNKAYGFSQMHPFSQYIKKSKNYAESNKRWEDAIDKADAYNSAHREMRGARKAYRRAKRG